MSYLPEFATQAGKDAFVKNHPIGDMAKPGKHVPPTAIAQFVPSC